MTPQCCRLYKRLTFHLVAYMWFILPLTSFSQSPYFKSIELSREIGQTEVQLLYQDTDGFMWLGTTKGLFKYNGLAYESYIIDDTLSEQSVKAIFQDSRETLWIGYQNGTIAQLKDNQLSIFSPEEGLPKVAITGIVEDRDNTMWFSTYGEGIYYYTNGRLYNINTDDNLNTNEVYSMALDKQGRVWAGTDAGIAICYLEDREKRVHSLTTQDGLPDNIVYQLEPDARGNIWIGMYDGGVCYYNTESLKLTIPKVMKDWTFGIVTSIAISPNEDLWVGTKSNGVVSITNQDRLNPLDNQNNLSASRVSDLLEDDQGQLWLVSQDGVYTANKSLEFIHFDRESSYGTVRALVMDTNDNLWFSTPSGLYQCTFSNGAGPEISRYDLGANTDKLNIISIHEDDFGHIWLGTFDQGIYRFKPSSPLVDHIDESDGLVNNNVLSISGSGNDIWFATLGGVSKCTITESTESSRSNLQFENFSQKDGVGVNYIYKVFIDSKGREWIATDGQGVTLLDQGRFSNYSEDHGVDNRIISITEDHDGQIWLSSPSNGIYAFDGSGFKHFSSSEGLNDLAITSLATEKNGNIVVISQTGIEELNPKTGHILLFGEESGITNINPDINAVAKDKYGNLWIGTQQGIIKFKGAAPGSIQPQTRLNNVSLYLNPITVKNGHTFKHDEDHISFNYIGLWYRDPKAVGYRHKLEGFDIDWINSRNQIATYPKLAPGNYRFEVESSINENFENSITTHFDFVVKTPFWSRSWFHILSVLVGTGILALLIKTREKRLRKTERVKNELMEAEFETLKSQVNPHFLFNSFNTLMGTIEEDKTVAIEYVEKLSDFFRNMLAYREKSLIRLQEELDLVMDYFFLQQKRFGSNLEIVTSITAKKKAYLIPPLTLQMLVENALKHNVISKTRPLKVEIFDHDNYLFIKNNKQLKKHLEPSTGFGLQSIIRRYQLLSDQPVKIENEFNHYQVGIPLLNKSVT